MQAPTGKSMQKFICNKQPLAVAVVLALAAQAQAHEHDHDQQTTRLPTSVVTGVAQSSPGTVVTDPKLPRQPVPASDAADYLKTIPGFSGMRSGGVNSDPSFRGMFGSRLKILSNGGEMLGACPNRMDSPSSYIAPETYDKLTVIKGPQSVQHGPGSYAAVVLFERGPEQFDEPGMRIDANVVAGSNNRWDRNLDAAIGNSQGYVRLMGQATRASDYKDGGRNKVPSRWDKWNAETALGWTPDDDTLLELTLGRGDGETRYGGRGMDGTRFLRENTALRFKKTNMSETWTAFEAQLYYNYADHIMANDKLRPAPLMPNGMPMAMATQVDRRTLGARVKSTWEWDDFELVAGMDAQTNWHRLRARYGSYPMKQPSVVRSHMEKDAEMNQLGVFGELTWALTERDRLIGGLRVDRHEATDEREYLEGRRNIPACPDVGTNLNCQPNPTANKKRTDTLPSGFIRHEHDMASLPATVYMGLGHSQRFPDYWELFSAANLSDGAGGYLPTAFKTVNPEKTTQLDFGFQYAQGPVELWASGYAGFIRDYILFSYKGANTTAHNVNARIMGAEIGGSHRFAPGWKADASLAYAWGKNSSDGRPLPQVAPMEARFGLGYERNDWSAGGLWRVVGKQSRVHEGYGNSIGKDFEKSSGFGVFSLNGAYRINSNWKFSAGIDNLFNKEYREHLNLDGVDIAGYSADSRMNEPGRIWWTRIDMSF